MAAPDTIGFFSEKDAYNSPFCPGSGRTNRNTMIAIEADGIHIRTTGKLAIEAAIHNVPVMFPSGGGFTMDVLLLSQRGLAN